jgi:hypothetical protein
MAIERLAGGVGQVGRRLGYIQDGGRWLVGVVAGGTVTASRSARRSRARIRQQKSLEMSR